MKFTIHDVVPYRRDEVYRVNRDDLPAIAPYLDRIESITVDSRVEEGGVTRIVNRWVAEPSDIPALARKFIKPEMMRWIDRATWDEDAWTCAWEMELGFLPDAIEARGVNRWEQRGDETAVTIEGEIIVRAEKIPGVPRLVAGKLSKAVESFVVTTIEPNLRTTNRAVARYIGER